MKDEDRTADVGPEGRIRPWGSLTFRDFRLLWIGGIFSGLARYMREMLNYFLIYEISGSAVQLGLTGVFQAIPVLTLGLLSGSIADRVDRKKLLIITHTVGLTAPFLLAFLIFADLVAVWHLWLLTSLSGAIAVVGGPAQRAYMARLVPRSHMMNAVTLLSVPTQGTLLVGPVLAGAIVDISGIGYAYLANGMLQVASLGALVLIATSGVPEGETGRRRVSVAAIVDGLRFTWQQKIIFAGFLIDYAAMAFGFYRILLPVLAKDVYGVGATGLGVLNAAPAIGAVIASILLLGIGDVRRKGVLLAMSGLAYAAFVALLGATPWFWLGLLATVGLGLTDMVSYTLRQALIQLVAPDNFRGRTAATSQMFSTLANSTGSLEIGVAAALLGPQMALVVGGGVSALLIVAISAKVKTLWQYGASFGPREVPPNTR